MLPPRPRSGKKPLSKQGRACVISDAELVWTYNRVATYVENVRRRVDAIGASRPLLELAGMLASEDPALAGAELVRDILTKPAQTAKAQTVKALKSRAEGFDLTGKLEQALRSARREPAGGGGWHWSLPEDGGVDA